MPSLSAERRRDLLYLCLCALLPVLFALLSLPWYDGPTGDDFVYGFMARELARTGELHFSGWANAMVGAQAYWGALFIRVFGFSYHALQASIVCLAAGSGAISYLTARQARLMPNLAAFAAMACLLSTVGVIVTPSFLTDIPALFFLVLTVYCFFRATDAAASQPPAGNIATAWRTVGCAASILGGTVRQVIWIVPPLLLIYQAWRFRSDRKQTVRCLLLLVVTVCVDFTISSWYAAQPFTLPDYLTWYGWPWLKAMFLPILLYASTRILYTFCLFLLPLSAAVLFHWCVSCSRWRIPVLIIAALGAIVCIPHVCATEPMAWPYLENNVTPCGLDCEGIFVQKPDLLSLYIRLGVLWAVLFSLWVIALAGGYQLVKWWQGERTASASALFLADDSSTGTGFTEVVQCGIVFVGYLGLTFSRLYIGQQQVLFDRYLLPLLLLLAIPVLWYYQRSGGRRIGIVPWLLIGVQALYGVVTIHDHFAAASAKEKAADVLQASGVPRRAIIGGYEYDGWTQLLEAGAIWDKHLRDIDKAKLPASPHDFIERFYWFRPQLPNLAPRYLILAIHIQGTTPAKPIAEIHYHTWLPPFDRTLRVEEIPEKHS